MTRALLPLAVAVVAVLVVFSGRYGYHRDELYFLAAGRRLAWGYPDQPPLTPLLARLVTRVADDSLVALRVPSAIFAGLVVLLTGLLARELGGGRKAQLLAAACMAVSSVLLVVSHQLGTSALDLLVWTALSLIVVRILRTRRDRLFLLAGLLAGVGLLNKTLVAFLLVAVAVGLVLSGPRSVLRSRWLWLGALTAVLIWSPNLWWQAAHGWPQLALSRAIAAGGSGTSESRWLFLPFQLVLVSPALVPVWVTGLLRLFRDPAVRWARCLAWAYVLLAVIFLVTGGKPYYICGLYPVLLAAGAGPVIDWATGKRARRLAVGSAVALSAVVSTVLMLPVLPAAWLHRTPIVSINYDAGETVGWPRFVETLAQAHRALPAADRTSAIILTGNYGEAGAVDRFGGTLGLPEAYSGHNAYGLWGPPPPGSGPVLAVGIEEQQLRRLFGSVQAVATIDNGLQLDNDEQGNTVWLCRDLHLPWAATWPQLRRLG
ncbi:MAG: glycosyltransferase family 39 protein [Propionibacteriaceae bacterium]|nr:glycosyltransferase family 39 protein [Propionibacteriaceae bacterium]